jgi:hypothetical protein
MNFIALIGIVAGIHANETDNSNKLLIKGEKPYVDNVNDDVFDVVNVNLDPLLFKTEIKQINKNDIVGIKGRISIVKNNGIEQAVVIAERLQVF